MKNSDFWFTATALVLCGIVAMMLICVGLGVDDDSMIPPETRPDGQLVPPPGYGS